MAVQCLEFPTLEKIMTIIANIFIMIVAAIHLYFAYTEFSSRNNADFYTKFDIKIA